MNLLIKFIIILCFAITIFNLTGCSEIAWPTTTNKEVIKTAKVEYDYESNIWEPSFSESSLEEADTTLDFSFLIANQYGHQQLPGMRYFEFYGSPTICTIMSAFEDSTNANRTRGADTIPFYLCATWYLFIANSGDTILALSCFKTIEIPGCGNLQNWTYVFKSNIDYWFSQSHLTAAYGWCITHELGHQIGRMAGYNAHDNHNGQTPTECLMNWGTPTILNIIQGDPDYMHVCPRHIDIIKDGPDLDLPVMINDKIGASAIKQEEDPTFKISLSKNEFKKFEPILIRFDYINNHSKVDTIFLNFVQNFDGVQFFISREEDNKLYKKVIVDSPFLFAIGPRYFIDPNDTFTVSMVMNYNHGEPVSDDNLYFGNMGYLEPGNYKLYCQDFIGGQTLKTNEVEFKVVDDDAEDKEVLQLIKNKKYGEVINNYPLNPFCEHAFAEHCFEQYPTETFDIDTSKVTDIFGNFIRKYPNSFYNINFEFVNSYFAKLTNKAESIPNLLDNIQQRNKGTLFEKFISNKAIKDRLSKMLSSLKKKLDEQKNNKK